MFVYALAKGVRHSYLPVNYMKTANDGYRGIQESLLSTMLMVALISQALSVSRDSAAIRTAMAATSII